MLETVYVRRTYTVLNRICTVFQARLDPNKWPDPCSSAQGSNDKKVHIPNTKPPPWSQTITGSLASRSMLGVHMLSLKQSSDCTGGNGMSKEDCPRGDWL